MEYENYSSEQLKLIKPFIERKIELLEKELLREGKGLERISKLDNPLYKMEDDVKQLIKEVKISIDKICKTTNGDEITPQQIVELTLEIASVMLSIQTIAKISEAMINQVISFKCLKCGRVRNEKLCIVCGAV